MCLKFTYCLQALLDACQVSVIKGNAGELAALAGSTEVRTNNNIIYLSAQPILRLSQKELIAWALGSRIQPLSLKS